MENKMRELTQKEIDNAPEWATHYDIVTPSGSAGRDTSSVMWWNDDYLQLGNYEKLRHLNVITNILKPIPRKEFDVSETTKGQHKLNTAGTVPCNCIGGCLEVDGFLQSDKEKMPEDVYCEIKNKNNKAPI